MVPVISEKTPIKKKPIEPDMQDIVESRVNSNEIKFPENRVNVL